MSFHAIWTDLFGWPGTWGTGGNMVAWVICGTLAFSWLHAKEKARHLAKMAQAQRHHEDLKQHITEQLAVHHTRMLAAVMPPPGAERVVTTVKPKGTRL